jgi:hypothetical protein
MIPPVAVRPAGAPPPPPPAAREVIPYCFIIDAKEVRIGAISV